MEGPVDANVVRARTLKVKIMMMFCVLVVGAGYGIWRLFEAFVGQLFL